MRNDVKPVTPMPSHKPPAHDTGYGVAGDDGFDDDASPGVVRERGDPVDPAGPKRSTTTDASSPEVVVDDPSGTLGTVTRSNRRTSTTTGSLGDRDLERSARQSAEPDVRALDIPLGDSSEAVPMLMAAFATLIGVLGLIALLYLTGVGAMATGIVVGVGVLALLGAAFFTRSSHPLVAVAAVVGAVLLAVVWLGGLFEQPDPVTPAPGISSPRDADRLLEEDATTPANAE